MAVPFHPAENEYPGTFADDLPDKTHAPLDEMPTSTFESSNVHSALYDFGTMELLIRFKRDGTDAVYQYRDVPPSEWNGLVQAASKGSYVNANIAMAYTYVKVGRGELMDIARSLPQSRIKRFVMSP